MSSGSQPTLSPTPPPPATAPARPRRAPRPAPRRGTTLGANFGSALEALWANRLRSLLTTLGVIVGVAAVIAAVTLTLGASSIINSRITGLGTNVLTISNGTTQTGGAQGGAGTNQSLSLDDEQALTAISHVSNASPLLTLSSQVIYINQNWNTRIQGVYPEFQSIQNWQLSEGAWFSQGDESEGLPVAVLGQTTTENLFGASGTDPIGQTILVRNQAFRVVGVLQAKGASFGATQDDIVFVPFNAAHTRLKNTQNIDQIQVQIDNANNVADAQQAVTTLLEQRHHLPTGGPDDFQIRSSNQLVQTAQQFSQTLTFLLVGIAAISLIVGGIGIMNIMLVSVTERTREIGIRMAIGARRRDIRNQFLIEAFTLSSAGGLIGIVLGLLIGLALTHAFGLPFAQNPLAILLAFGVSAAIGVTFGFYPAVRASQLDPIVALHTE